MMQTKCSICKRETKDIGMLIKHRFTIIGVRKHVCHVVRKVCCICRWQYGLINLNIGAMKRNNKRLSASIDKLGKKSNIILLTVDNYKSKCSSTEKYGQSAALNKHKGGNNNLHNKKRNSTRRQDSQDGNNL